MTRPLCAYAPDPERSWTSLALGWALRRPHEPLFVLALTIGAIWSLHL